MEIIYETLETNNVSNDLFKVNNENSRLIMYC